MISIYKAQITLCFKTNTKVKEIQAGNELNNSSPAIRIFTAAAERYIIIFIRLAKLLYDRYLSPRLVKALIKNKNNLLTKIK